MHYYEISSKRILAKSIFLGGGTPLVFQVGFFRFTSFYQDFFPLQSQTEITVEANPNTLDENKVDLLLRGVNRVSLGVNPLIKITAKC